MTSLRFPQFARPKHEIQNVNEILDASATRGEQAADVVANIVGSWPFIIIQSCLLVLWIVFNITGWINAWDPYPFILMNLVLSTQAAFTAPIIMMSQNRQAAKDRIEAHNDYEINQKTFTEVDIILKQLEAQNEALITLHHMLEQIQTRLESSETRKQ